MNKNKNEKYLQSALNTKSKDTSFIHRQLTEQRLCNCRLLYQACSIRDMHS